MRSLYFMAFVTVVLLGACQTAEQKLKEKELAIREMELKQQEADLLREREERLARKERELEKERRRMSDGGTNGPTGTVYGSYPEGSTRYLGYEDVRNKSSQELRIMRNEIYARHGYIFKSEDLRLYFSQQSWYQPMYVDVENDLSKMEKTNIQYIKSFE